MFDLLVESCSPELGRPLSAQDFGSVAGRLGWSAKIEEQVMPLRVDRVFARLGKAMPPETDLWEDVWLVPNRVAVMRWSRSAEVTSVGLECDYSGGRESCRVAGVVPRPDLVTLGGKCAGKIGPTGEVTASSGTNGNGHGNGSLKVMFENGIALGSGAPGDAHATFSLVLPMPRVSATVVGSQMAHWQFEAGHQPLFGRGIETWSLLALPKGTRQLTYRARLYFVMRTEFIPTLEVSEWVDIACDLPG